MPQYYPKNSQERVTLEKKKYHSIFISDIHLIAQGCEGERLSDFLDNNWCENLFLVGDILDGWRSKSSILKLIGLRKNHFGVYCDRQQVRVIKKILSKISRHKVFYILGNHDDFMEEYIDEVKEFGNLSIHKQFVYTSISGKKFLIIHGHQFDGIIKYHEQLAFIADYSYQVLISLSKIIQWIRSKIGFKDYWSLSYLVKHKVKQGVEMIYNLEKALTGYCESKGLDGVICGHSHYPAIKKEGNVMYLNCGDWVDSCTAIVEDFDGNIELIRWNGSVTHE